MKYKYCPNCGAEYFPDIELCSDCQVELVDEPVEVTNEENAPRLVRRTVVFTTGRRIDAEMVRSMLESHGLDARVWASGMGPYRMESALTELTGIPNAFNAYGVAVLEEQADEARAILADVDEKEPVESSTFQEVYPYWAGKGMAMLRSRWLLIGVAMFLLAVILLNGPLNR